MSPEFDPIALRWYRRPQIDEVARVIRERAEAGLLSQLDLALELSALIFRDAGGGYWFLDAWTAAWHRFDGQDWMLARGEPLAQSEPPRDLEGLDGLAAPPAPIGPPPAADVDLTLGGAHTSPTEALAAAQAALRDAYRSGWIDSAAAEALLGRSVLIDADGRVWTAGAGSGAWYQDEGTGWSRAPAPPDLASLASPRPPAGPCPSCGTALEGALACPVCGAAVPLQIEGLSEAAHRRAICTLLAGEGALPEPLTAPWAPPPGYPNLELPRIARRAPLVPVEAEDGVASPAYCIACGAELRPGVRFCGRCGAPLAAAGGGGR